MVYLTARSGVLDGLALAAYPMRRKHLVKEAVQSILVIAFGRIGDAVMCIPAFRAIRRGFPRARVTVLTSSCAKGILENVDTIDTVVAIERRASFFRKAKAVMKLSPSGFDLAIDLTCGYTLEEALLAFLSGARYRVGYDLYGRGLFFNRPVKWSKTAMHAVDEFLNVVGSIGVTADDTRLVLSAPADAEAEVRRYLEAGGVRDDELLVGIHPGGHYWTQRWPPERFARLSDAITEEYKAKAVLITGPGEGPLAGEVLSKMSRPPLVFSGRPTGHLIALIWRCDLLICNNSGPLHIAAALGTPTVSMMGPTIPERWWPRGEGHIVIRKDLPCMPCNEGRCPIGTHDCMRLITVQDVIDAVESQLSRRPKVAKHA